MELIYCNNTEHGALRALSILMNVNAVFLHITVLYLPIYCRQAQGNTKVCNYTRKLGGLVYSTFAMRSAIKFQRHATRRHEI